MKLVTRNTKDLFDHNSMITDSNILGKKVKQSANRPFTDYGLFSTLIFGDYEASDEYKCKCGNMKGKVYAGCTCPKCKTQVGFIEKNIVKNGWIDISGNQYDENGNVIKQGRGFKIIKFIQYLQLEKIIGSKILRDIITMLNIVDLNGDIDTEELEAIRSKGPEYKYVHIGLIEFYNNYDEILEYYHNLSEQKYVDAYEFVRVRDEVFTDKICVVSPIIRPAVRTATGIKLDEINKYYNDIIKANQLLNNNTVNLDLIDNVQISIIQAKYFNLCQYVIKLISGKNGWIRQNISGARVNFCARNIITPAKIGKGIDTITLPYLTVMILWKFEIINLIQKVKGCSVNVANDIWFKGTLDFDNELYLIMRKMIKDNKLGVLLNRNPTINYGSILYLTVCDVKKDFNDITASISNIILKPMAADYDGDTLNIYSIKDADVCKVLERVFSPKKMLISSNNGKFNNEFSLEHDLIMGGDSLLW